MILNGESNIPQEVDSKRFAQLGLLAGSFMFWEEDRDDPHPQRLEKLMRWTLELPPVLIGEENCYPRLGVSTSGFAHIYYTILQAKKSQGPLSKAQEADEETITKELARLGILSASTQQDIKEPDNNYLHFEPHIDEFARYVECLSKIEIAKLRRREAAPRMYIWLDRKDNDWWVTAIRNTFDDYLQLMSEKRLEPSDVEKLCEWLECSVFASLDISQPLPTFNEAEEKSAVLAEQVFQGARKVNGAGSKSRHFYLTWDLFAFDLWGDYWREQLLHRTMLVLWTAWPDDLAWAPMPPKGFFLTLSFIAGGYSLTERPIASPAPVLLAGKRCPSPLVNKTDI